MIQEVRGAIERNGVARVNFGPGMNSGHRHSWTRVGVARSGFAPLGHFSPQGRIIAEIMISSEPRTKRSVVCLQMA